jgi:prophage regulatory protein
VAISGRPLHSLQRRGDNAAMSINMLRLPAVLAKTGLSPSTIWRYEKAGTFPRRRQLGPNSVGWIVEEVDAWLERRRVAASRPGIYVMSNDYGKLIGPFADHREAWKVSQAVAEGRRG